MANPTDAGGTSNPSGLPEALHHPPRQINLFAGTIGHFVEWYDWYIYGLLAAVFSSHIFPSHSTFASLMAALLTYAIPASFLIVPYYRIMHTYGLTNDLWAVIAAQVAFAVPFAILILQLYARLIPFELDDAARYAGRGAFPRYR